MSIQSTITISRELAIDRITEVANLIRSKDYRGLKATTFEPDHILHSFVDNWVDIDLDNINNWTDNMLEELIDRPFFRKSMFDNYVIQNT